MGDLGKTIGVISHSLKITNSVKDIVTIGVEFDYSTMDDQAIKNLIVRSTTIDFQRPTRLLSASEIKSLNGTVVIAQNAGRKVQSASEIKAQTVALLAGMSKNDRLTYLQEMMDKLDIDEVGGSNDKDDFDQVINE